MKTINLLPKEEQDQIRLDLTNYQLKVFWTTVFVSMLVFGGLGFAAQQYLKITINGVKDEIYVSQMRLESSDIRALQEQVTVLNRNIREIKNLRSNQYQWSEVLLEIARIMPADAQLNSIQLERATGEVVILGKARNREMVIETWSQLKKSELFTDVNFPLPNLERPTDSNFTYTFKVQLEKIKRQ